MATPIPMPSMPLPSSASTWVQSEVIDRLLPVTLSAIAMIFSVGIVWFAIKKLTAQ